MGKMAFGLRPSELLKSSGAKRVFSGFYRGTVEYNLDPLANARCKVRVRPLHQGNDVTTVAQLPWAQAMNAPSGFDFGERNIPPVGSKVWVVFEQGSKDMPVYIWGWPSVSYSTRKTNIVLDKNGNAFPTTDANISMGEWDGNAGPGGPRETHLQTEDDPQVRGSKTIKGHTILSDDRDEAENLVFVDRLGQVLRMVGRVTTSANAANAAQRGIRTVEAGDAIAYSNLVGAYARVTLSDQQGQAVTLESAEGGESVRISSNASQGPSDGVSGDRVSIDLSGISGRQIVELAKDDKVLIYLVYDGNIGSVSIDAAVAVSIQATHINLDAETVNVSGTLTAQRVVAPKVVSS